MITTPPVYACAPPRLNNKRTKNCCCAGERARPAAPAAAAVVGCWQSRQSARNRHISASRMSYTIYANSACICFKLHAIHITRTHSKSKSRLVTHGCAFRFVSFIHQCARWQHTHARGHLVERGKKRAYETNRRMRVRIRMCGGLSCQVSSESERAAQKVKRSAMSNAAARTNFFGRVFFRTATLLGSMRYSADHTIPYHTISRTNSKELRELVCYTTTRLLN